MAENEITGFELTAEKSEYSQDENIVVNAKFSIKGKTRESFNEKNWTYAYENNDTSFKLKYGIKLNSGGLRKKEVGNSIDSYRKASIFWTRNPKLVNPMKEKRIWVQVAKNFEPFIKLSEEEVREELFDFKEEITFKASELGKGRHKINAEAFASWQKHDYADADTIKGNSKDLEISIN